MNQFQSTESGSGILKDFTDESPLAQALRRKRERLAQTRLGISEDKQAEGEPEDE